MHYEIIFVGINYKTPQKTLDWMKSLVEKNINGLIIVVDNSADYNPELGSEVEKMNNEKIMYVDTKNNLGYFNGAFYAFQYIDGKGISFDWLCISNVDVELCDCDLSDELKKYSDVGIVAPSIVSMVSGIDKNPYRVRRAKKRELVIKKIAFSNSIFSSMYRFLSMIRNKQIHNDRERSDKYKKEMPIYLPYGACMFFSNSFFEKGGTIKFPFFLFGEELFVAEQCRSMGLDIVYVPKIRFKNYEHASTGALSNRFIDKENYKMISYILKNYY